MWVVQVLKPDTYLYGFAATTATIANNATTTAILILVLICFACGLSVVD